MPELTREEKLKLVEKLPQQLQDLLYSEDTGAFLLYLGQKYSLPDEKVRLLSKLVGDVVLKIVPITSLAQEINSKITSDAQAAMNLTQELYAELLAPVMAAPSIPPTPATPATPVAPAPTSTPLSPRPVVPPTASTPARPVDKYREPTFSMPEIVDLRKIPPSITTPSRPIIPPTPIAPTPPLTFTRPIEPAAPAQPVKLAPQPIYAGRPPLIEAEPHKILTPTPKPIDTYRELTETQGPPLVSTPIPISTPPASEPRPQYIMRPSGAPPTHLPDNVLDLRKDKGEF